MNYESCTMSNHGLFFLAHYQQFSHFIHNSLFWCKFNKFISFFSKKAWKTFKLSANKRVDIPSRILLWAFLWIIRQVIHRVINTIINSFFAFPIIYFNYS